MIKKYCRIYSIVLLVTFYSSYSSAFVSATSLVLMALCTSFGVGVHDTVTSNRDQYPIANNVIDCGKGVAGFSVSAAKNTYKGAGIVSEAAYDSAPGLMARNAYHSRGYSDDHSSSYGIYSTDVDGSSFSDFEFVTENAPRYNNATGQLDHGSSFVVSDGEGGYSVIDLFHDCREAADAG